MGVKYLIFGIMMTFLGFCLAATGASLFLVKGEGFSAATTVVFYGFAGGATGLVAAVILSRGLSEDGFRKAFRIVLALTLIAVCAVVYRVVTLAEKQSAGDTIFGAGVKRSGYH